MLSLELSQDLNGNSQASAARQKMAQLEQMLSALDQLRRVGACSLQIPPSLKRDKWLFLYLMSSARCLVANSDRDGRFADCHGLRTEELDK